MLNNIDALDLKNKRVLVRVDFNVPLQNHRILDDSRIQSVLPTLQAILNKGAALILLSHLGDPKAGTFADQYSLEPIAHHLASLLNQPVRFEKDWINGVFIQSGEVVLCENVRFLLGETQNDETLAQKMAALCDVVVMEAFSVAHRVHSSMVGLVKCASLVVPGPLFLEECKVLSSFKKQSQSPRLAIIGGAKIATKLPLLFSLLEWVNVLIIGGGISNTFLKAQGISIGQSLVDDSVLEDAKRLLEKAKSCNIPIILPIDAIVQRDEKIYQKEIVNIEDNEKIYDVGLQTLNVYKKYIDAAATILWNGPLGAFENPNFSQGTFQVIQKIAMSKAYTVAGGGETLAAIKQCGGEEKFSYLSTGGGAFLAYLEQENLPVIHALKERGAL